MKFIRVIIGTLFGIVLYFVFSYLIINIEFILFSEKELVNGIEVGVVHFPKQYVPMHSWITFGVFPLFLVVGQYLLYGITEGGSEKKNEIMAMKSILIGYFIWIPVTLIIGLLAINIPDRIYTIAGFLTMIIVYFFMKNKIAMNKGNP
ncbi:MAG: hypothetical protein K8R25_15295 [Methanosarcinales archaeon]|nr:hypothetical protein [Methanosarcinales archaeon]